MATRHFTEEAAATSGLAAACFKIGSITALIGVSLGIYMGIGKDHSLAPVHVHLNLIGWVSMFLFGLFYKLHKAAVGKVAVTQVMLSTVGFISMMSGLAGYLLTGNGAFAPLIIGGSFMIWTGFALFAYIVARAA